MSNYRVILSHASERGVFVARVPELDNCVAEGETRAEALERVEQEMQAQVDNMQEQGLEPPLPLDDQELDGELSCRVLPSIHRELALLARMEQVELEELLPQLLAQAVLPRRPGPPRQGGREGGRRGRSEGGGRRYHQIMENRADFIEYVRNQEKGGGRQGGGRGRGGRGRRRD